MGAADDIADSVAAYAKSDVANVDNVVDIAASRDDDDASASDSGDSADHNDVSTLDVVVNWAAVA